METSELAQTARVPLNVVIPMGGLGLRFQKEGYVTPKPLVNIFARPMISWLVGNLKFERGDTLFIAVQKVVEEKHNIVDLLRKEFPTISVKLTLLDDPTRGAAETLFLTLIGMTEDELKQKTISLDCDTLYFDDVLQDFRELPADESSCSYFVDKGDTNIFSYIKIDEHTQLITDVAEKKAISRNANTGAYGFANANLLKQFLAKLLNEPLPQNGEFYISAVIATMIQSGCKFTALPVSNFHCVGTPRQLRTFIAYKWIEPDFVEKRVIRINIDRSESWDEKDLCSPLPISVEGVLRPNHLQKAIALKELGFDVKLVTSHPERYQGHENGMIIADDLAQGRLTSGSSTFDAEDDLDKMIGW